LVFSLYTYTIIFIHILSYYIPFIYYSQITNQPTNRLHFLHLHPLLTREIHSYIFFLFYILFYYHTIKSIFIFYSIIIPSKVFLYFILLSYHQKYFYILFSLYIYTIILYLLYLLYITLKWVTKPQIAYIFFTIILYKKY